MALPEIASIQDCANFSLVVEPFLPQLRDLPYKLLDTVIAGDEAGGTIFYRLQDLYNQTNPLVSGFAASLLFAAGFLAVSELNQNFSQVDRLWSILPNLYVMNFAVWARANGISHERIDLATLATTFWSIRLTFNYWRKGGYKRGSEDYRCCIQSILLFLFSGVPAYLIFLTGKIDVYIHGGDLAYFLICLALVGLEYIADGQQWNYHQAKISYQATAKVPKGYTQEELERGFITRGLWKYVRHPNFVGEQLFWYTLYQWSCMATQDHAWWAFTGSCLLILLFQASTALTETITSSKYSEYKVYQNQVGMFFPLSAAGFNAPQPRGLENTQTSDLAKRMLEREAKKQA
ncbi:hypothetical protein Cpir12675_002511 [Ceratocystis pirilliformis]|uniref:Steroid 5-alpha reductase C-terminal domain-containing protein n=1 Tax=Ceratocystis pirilliformis TaxID=259994 RepID=A0ABR3Z948_9PEZI